MVYPLIVFLVQVPSISGFMSHPPVLHADEAVSPQRTAMTYEKTIVVSNIYNNIISLYSHMLLLLVLRSLERNTPWTTGIKAWK